MEKRGQVTIFIIIGILIVLAGVLIYLFYPQIQSFTSGSEQTPSSVLESCLEEDVKNSIELISSQGGSANPEHYMLYNNEKIQYLCYTNEYYIPCIMQKPMLNNHVKTQIKEDISSVVNDCLDSMEEVFDKKGYNVNLKKGDYNVELLPNKIEINFDSSISLTKGDETLKAESFKVVVNNNIYELVSIATSILDMETTYGDAETTIYMDYYHDKKVEKKKQSDGTTIYILTDRDTQDKFQFASRSVAWPPGYQTESVVN